ncbi:MAG TPA: sulfite exporter TauE/SafE family protein [Clostridia bacterium]|nr:sulfite exporter TauE/SafE family protein [Clostridia bacterium]
MEQKILRKVLQIGGMTCTSCEMRIENKLRKLEGISDVKAIYSSSNVYVTYDANLISLGTIIYEIEKLDYTVKNKSGSQQASQQDGSRQVGQQGGNVQGNKKSPGIFGRNRNDDSKMPINQVLGIGIIILALYLIIKNTVGFNFIPQVNQNMGYGILFVVGLITSLHCVAMCGGINLSQCVSYRQDSGDAGRLAKVKPSLLYNTGRVISYTILGGIVGALGSVVSFSGTAKGIIAILSGVFMVIMGLNMLNIFPWLRKLNPRMPRIFGNKIHQNCGKYGPFYVGLLNGLMPCGPLQAMQIYALGTGSAFAGALSMLFFSLGTLPLMFGLGALSSLLSGKFTHKMMKVSAVLVMVLGIIMLNRGLNLSGFNIGGAVFAASTTAASGNVAQVSGSVQTITTTLQPNSYTPFIVQKGIPVKWTIRADASNINGCNGTVTIPKYGISQKLVPGDNVIEFMPDAEGNIPYTCWMGMISSNIKVVADVGKVTQSDLDQSQQSQGSSSGIGAGGCCGATPPGFANGKIPVDNIQTAKQNGDTQEITVTVDNNGYTPAAFVVQKGVPVVVKFKTSQLSGCNSSVYFPEFNGGMDLTKQTETPALPADQDFTFQCGMNMLHGYVKVVDNISNFDMASVKKAIENYKPAAGSTGGGGCCG